MLLFRLSVGILKLLLNYSESFMSDREFDLFKEMMADVAPIKQDTILIQQKYQVSEAQLARRLAAQTLANNNIDYLSLDTAKMVKPDDMIEFKRDGVQQAVFKKMRQGKYDIHARLDLHKKTLSQARDEVLAFLKQSQQIGRASCRERV